MLALPSVTRAQGLGGAGTVQGTVVDPSGAVVPGATVELSNPVTQFSRPAETDSAGQFVFRNLPPSPYHLTVTLMGFQPLSRDVTVRTAVPIVLSLQVRARRGLGADHPRAASRPERLHGARPQPRTLAAARSRPRRRV